MNFSYFTTTEHSLRFLYFQSFLLVFFNSKFDSTFRSTEPVHTPSVQSHVEQSRPISESYASQCAHQFVWGLIPTQAPLCLNLAYSCAVVFQKYVLSSLNYGFQYYCQDELQHLLKHFVPVTGLVFVVNHLFLNIFTPYSMIQLVDILIMLLMSFFIDSWKLQESCQNLGDCY